MYKRMANRTNSEDKLVKGLNIVDIKPRGTVYAITSVQSPNLKTHKKDWNG